MVAQKAGALINEAETWHSIVWKTVQSNIRRLQMRIAKAIKEKKSSKAKALQWLLTHSFHAKLFAVKRVTTNKGKKTPGVDGVLWKGAKAKMQAAKNLRRRGYKPYPLKRIYIPKKNGKKRPLSIPTMKCRAMQALYKLALSPIAETTADINSYGFRELRGCADAIAQGFNALSKPNSATWILEGDIKGCFDNISFQWMLDNIPMDKEILTKWLNAGYVENKIRYPSRKGTPQGGIISPTLANMTLDGLEQIVKEAAPRRSRINFVRYADDFIVTGKSKQILETKVKPAIEAFLLERGLQLSPEKTHITHIQDGFTFLGQTFRKYGNKVLIKPSQESIKAIKQKAGNHIRNHKGKPIPAMIKNMNQALRGWGNYHRHVVSSETFRHVDNYIYHQLWRMLKQRHRQKTKVWLTKKYWTAAKGKYIFSVKVKTKKKTSQIYQLFRLRQIGIKRHIKIRAKANPYSPEYGKYFYKRRHDKKSRIATTWGGC